MDRSGRVLWTRTRRSHLYDADDDDGKVYVRFGDGVTGQRLPTGNRNVAARYRAGAGSNGNVDANSITQMLQSVSGVQSVVNPLPAFGGADGEPIDRTRENAPVSVLTLGRAVSLARL